MLEVQYVHTLLSWMHFYTWTYRLTFKRQALVTTCLGSTTSTRGSLMATLRMQLMSNPYTFSHPALTQTRTFKPQLPMWIYTHTVCDFWIFTFLNFDALLRLVSLCSCQAVSTKRVAGENKTERLTLPGRTLLHSCCLSVYPGPMWRKTGPPENRLQPPPRPLPCLAGFLIIIWAAHTKQAFPPSFPLSLHSTLLFQRATHKSVWWEGAICHQRREKLKIRAWGFGWTLFIWDFVWKYFYVHI